MSTVSPGTVTLTQEQLNSILATVGKLVTGKDNGLQITVDPVTSKINVTKGSDKTSKTTNNKLSTNIRQQNGTAVKPNNTKGGNTKPNRGANKKLNPPRKVDSGGKSKNIDSDRNSNVSPSDTVKNKDSETTTETETETVNESGDVKDGDNTALEKDKSVVIDADIVKSETVTDTTVTSQPSQPTQVSQPDPTPTHPPPTIPTGPLTMAERKRLQWQKEREEIQTTGAYYDPWGRPGCGAPSKPINIAIVQPTRNHQVPTLPQHPPSQVVQNSTQYPTSHSTNPSTFTNPPTNQTNSPTTNHLSPTANNPSIPAALRSSIAVGDVSPNTQRNRHMEDNDRQSWLRDLEKQRDEQRLLKAKEKEKYRETFQETWADKYMPHPPPIINNNHVVTMETPAVVVDPEGAQSRVSSAPQVFTQESVVAGGDAKSGDSPEKPPQSFLHGQNLYIDPVTKNELEEKRRRQLEHQKLRHYAYTNYEEVVISVQDHIILPDKMKK